MKRYLVILLLVLSTSSVTGQRIYFHTTGYMGFKNTLETEYFYDGGGIELGCAQKLSKGRLVTGLNYRLIYWGHQVGLSAAYDYPLWEEGSWRASVQAGAGVDLALFVKRSLWGWNTSALPHIEWQSKESFSAFFGLGVQYNNNPAYQEYGAIHSTWDVPIRLGMAFRLQQKEH